MIEKRLTEQSIALMPNCKKRALPAFNTQERIIMPAIKFTESHSEVVELQGTYFVLELSRFPKDDNYYTNLFANKFIAHARWYSPQLVNDYANYLYLERDGTLDKVSELNAKSDKPRTEWLGELDGSFGMRPIELEIDDEDYKLHAAVYMTQRRKRALSKVINDAYDMLRQLVGDDESYGEIHFGGDNFKIKLVPADLAITQGESTGLYT